MPPGAKKAAANVPRPVMMDTMVTSTNAGNITAPMVDVRDLCKRFSSRDGDTTLALDHVSFTVQDGQFVSVVGPSGCGKSTLLAILAGVMRRSSGEVSLSSRPVDGPRRDVWASSFQEALLLPYRTVLQNIMLPAIIHRLPQAQYQ